MSVVNSDLNTLLQTVKNMQTAIDSIETTKASISTKYQQLGYGWNDKKYKDLGDVVNACSKSLNTILKTLLQGEKYVALLVKSLQEYENANLAGELHRQLLILHQTQLIPCQEMIIMQQ